jgi:octaprenyl-diphosphate synthase
LLVEEELARQLDSEVALVGQVGRHTLESGGKRLRPAFVAMAAHATGLSCDPDRLAKLGACMEMIHMATLIHDDVIDKAATRRGRATASVVFGNTASILAGDAMLARAMVLLALDGDLAIIRNVSQAVVEMAEGEVRELEVRGDLDLGEDAHLEVLRMKTAAFIQSCCEIGAIAAGGDDGVREALASYGHHIGIAFQVVDDLLDYRGECAKTGKPKATDFREGCATLPLIYLLPELSAEERVMAEVGFGNGGSDEDLRIISGWMRERGAFDRSEALARRHVARALRALDALPDTAARPVLEGVGRLVLQREA